MGCDIHVVAQKRGEDGKWEKVTGKFADGTVPFDWRSYRNFSFMAGVRRSSNIVPLSLPRGLPWDFNYDENDLTDDDDWLGDHSFSWLAIEELLAVDYTRPWKGVEEPLGEFLGPDFLADLQKAKELGIERIVFGFDS